MNRSIVSLSLVVALTAAPRLVSAATYRYVDWTAANVPGGTASGTISLPDGSSVNVTFEAINSNGSAGNLYGAQTSTGTNFWNPSTPYISAAVENAPPTTDILQLAGGQNQTYRVTLSEPIKDPIMAMVSLGQPSLATTYDFDAPFTIVSQGTGYWGGNASSLSILPDDVLRGTEGHGTIQFIGTFSTFSWTVPTPETWHGFTFGIRTTERLEPPDAGPDAEADASTPDAGDPDAAVSDAEAPDAAVSDSGTPGNDSGPSTPARDASVTIDGGGTTGTKEGGVSLEGGTTDAGQGGSSDDGCGCVVIGGQNSAAASGSLAAIAFALIARQRRRLRRNR